MDTTYDPSDDFFGNMSQRGISDDSYLIDQKPILIPNPETGFSDIVYPNNHTNGLAKSPLYNNNHSLNNNSPDNGCISDSPLAPPTRDYKAPFSLADDDFSDAGGHMSATEDNSSGQQSSRDAGIGSNAVKFADIAADLDISDDSNDDDSDEDMIEVPPPPTDFQFMF